MEHVFTDEWRDGNFLIPANREFRSELLEKMIKARTSDRARDGEFATHVRVLEARIAAVVAYDDLR